MIRYHVRIDRPASHLFSVELELESHDAASVDLEFPAWSPGRYIIYDFARAVQELEARGERGERLTVERRAKGTWRVHCEGHSNVRISYRMFGNTLSGTFSQLDDRHASINGASVFGYIVGRMQEPMEVGFTVPDGWHIYTAMKKVRRKGGNAYVADNYDQLIDSPIEIGTPLERRFTHDGVTYHLIIDIAAQVGTRPTRALRERIDRYVGDTAKIVQAYTDTFGAPEFDTYYFLVNIDPYAAGGDGMEHQASTRLVLCGSIMSDDHYKDLVAVTSHEFFHVWNVKRLRPTELGPFDYTQELHTTLLWFAEGFTQYYGHLMVRRAGVWNDEQFFKNLVGEINAVDKSPGRFHTNLRASSFDTWGAVSPRSPMAPTSNFRNTWVNYYHKGAVTALLLDLDIRRRSNGARSLDDVVQRLYRLTYAEAPFEEYYLRGHGFTEDDVLAAVAHVGGRASRAYLKGLIESTEELDYAAHMRYVGLELKRVSKRTRKRKGAADAGHGESDGERPQLFTGLVLQEPGERAGEPFVRVMNVLPDSPADRAGFSEGDLLLALDDDRVDGKRWEQVVALKEPGDRPALTFFRGARLMTLSLRIEERDTRSYRIEPISKPTSAQQHARSRWLDAS